ncbi:hypothetical protein DEU56DRAFT_778456 [Suillus clintonianus]|uniref:uncharacterized protein n=1 Tax=Suillus clintonianus TaxID=1904413 RepID=UPI001B87C1BB|nr:uncharacterized protein DEU56DRAFT_778456 [Suillus clintonianus]KAG2151540.1 hypothetical protein DEU56DRAFT_778456 [Suillus clintonianus]
MRLHKGSQACLLLLVHAIGSVVAVDFAQCLTDIIQNANTTQNLTGLLDGDGNPVSNASNATSISYSMCASQCGTGQEPFQWAIFSQEFSAWLLPNLALISQLPFGAQYRLDNLMSAVLTVGSPALAGYSLFITLLNSRWIKRRFDSSVDYPNSRFALSILSSLQQVPLRLHPDPVRLPSLIVLPENDSWWKCLAEFVDYTHTWSIASATSIAWVIIAYILTVANSLSNVYADVQSNGEATGSMWLWLIPVVVGWLQLSPKCDFDRLKAAYDRADRHSIHTGPADVHVGRLPASSRRALAITAKEEDVMSPDELLTPPVFNYSRSLRWASTAETVFLVFKAASEKAHSHKPICGSDWVEPGTSVSTHEMECFQCSDSTHDIETIQYIDDTQNIDHRNRYGSPQDVVMYCTPPNETRSSHWAPGVFTRMAIASCASLGLQWGTVGAAFLVGWFTPTTKMGCRSIGYLLYGAISTLIWMMLLVSSILAHYSTADPLRARGVLSARSAALKLSHLLRWTGKLLAIINFFLAIMACVFQYSSFYDRCYCNSSVFSRHGAAYAVIIETAAQAAQAKTAWVVALVLACTSATAFLALLNLLLDTLPS